MIKLCGMHYIVNRVHLHLDCIWWNCVEYTTLLIELLSIIWCIPLYCGWWFIWLIWFDCIISVIGGIWWDILTGFRCSGWDMLIGGLKCTCIGWLNTMSWMLFLFFFSCDILLRIKYFCAWLATWVASFVWM